MSNNQISELAQKISKGLDISFAKLVHEKAKNDGVLVISDKDGKVIKVKAKDLLEKM